MPTAFRFLPLIAIGLFIPAAPAQVSIGGLSFVDRNQTGEIVLGAMRGGPAVIDYDRDGWPDLLVGDRAGFTNRLFRNIADPARPGLRTFVDVTVGSGLNDAEGVARDAIGALVADYDNDGDEDVYFVGRSAGVASFGLLYRNDGGVFTNVSGAAGVRIPGGNAESASWNDVDLDGYVDLLICGNAAPYVTLLRNNHNGTFSDAAALLPPIPTLAHAYSHGWMDYDNDGWADCFILNMSGAGHDLVLHNISDGASGRRFANSADAIGFVALGVAPMGIAAGDYDGDGDLDLGVSDGDLGTYFQNQNGTLVKITPFANFFAWGCDWLDADNDGRLDYFTSGSFGRNHLDNLRRNLGGGVFTDVSAALNGASLPTQHSVQLDMNNDGRLDIIAINPFDSVSIYENVSTTGNHWLTLRLVGTGPVNRDAIGARVRLTAGGMTQMRELVSGSSTTSTEDLRLHFGLGTATVVDSIEVVWPRRGALAARTETFAGPYAADQLLTLSPQLRVGDVNCDGLMNNFDIDAFVLALIDPAGYGVVYPGCDRRNADVDQDGLVNNFDIDPFVECVVNGCP